MKKIIAFLILSIMSCNLAFAEVTFFEDFTFYGELITDIDLSKEIREQEIQLAFPSPINKKIPIILNGKAKFTEVNDKPMICLQFDELSIDARKRIPVEVLVTGVNGKQLEQACYPNQNWYKTGLIKTNKYAKEFALFPITRFNAIPKIAKPSANNFVMILEPVYFVGGIVLSAISPFTAPLAVVGRDFCDIHKGSIIEFQFLREVTKDELNRALSADYL